MNYSRFVAVDSVACPGVSFVIRRLSFLERIELLRQVRTLAGELECRTAGERIEDRVDAALLEARIDRLYLQSGLHEITGLVSDGEVCRGVDVLERGPFALCEEIARCIRRETFLSEDERKN